LQIRLFDSQDRSDRAKIADQITAIEQQTPFEDSGVQVGGPLPVQNLQASLQPNEAVLEYVLDDPDSYCLVIQRQSINLVRLTGKAAIVALVDRELAAIKSKSLALAEGRALYSAVIQPVERLSSTFPELSQRMKFNRSMSAECVRFYLVRQRPR